MGRDTQVALIIFQILSGHLHSKIFCQHVTVQKHKSKMYMGQVTGIQYQKAASSEGARGMTYSPISQVMQAPPSLEKKSPWFSDHLRNIQIRISSISLNKRVEYYHVFSMDLLFFLQDNCYKSFFLSSLMIFFSFSMN